MTVTWKNKYHPDVIIKELEKAIKINEKGNVEFIGWGSSINIYLLGQMFEFSTNISETQKKSIVRNAIFYVGKKGKINKKGLLAKIRQLEKGYLDLKPKKYVLYTTISIDKEINIKSAVFDDVNIKFSDTPSKIYNRSALDLYNTARENIHGEIPNNYKYVRIHVSALSEYEAADKALNGIDLYRGIWNLLINLEQRWRMSFGGKYKPVNKIICGPIHTLHYPNGKLASSTWWYESSYIEPVSLYNNKEKFRKLKPLYKRIRIRLNKLKYSEEIIEALMRYTRSLDESNLNNAYVKLWGVLELLTGSQKERYDVTVRRTLFLFNKNVDYHNQILEHLRDYRNQYIHEDYQNNDIESLLYRLKFYIEELFLFHVFNEFKFQSFDEVKNFLDLSNDKERIKKELTIRKSALNYKK